MFVVVNFFKPLLIKETIELKDKQRSNLQLFDCQVVISTRWLLRVSLILSALSLKTIGKTI